MNDNEIMIEVVASPTIKKEIPESWWRQKLNEFLDNKEELQRHTVEYGDREVQFVLRLIEDTVMLVVIGFSDEIDSLEHQLEESGATNGEVPVEVACSGAIELMFTEDELQGIVDETLRRLGDQSPSLDGVTNIAALHSYKHQKGRVETFTVYIRSSPTAPMQIHIGLPEEINQLQESFQEETESTVVKTPKLKAEERKRKRKAK